MIEDIFLSRALILVVFGVMLAVVTRWAWRTREFAGYGLGWLIGLFFIIVINAVSGDSATEVIEADAQGAGNLSFFEAVFPSVFGLIIGFGLMYITRAFVSTHRRRAPTIAIFTATLILTMYFLITADDDASQVIGIFALAFTIGALSYVVFAGGGRRSSAAYSAQVSDGPPGGRVSGATQSI